MKGSVITTAAGIRLVWARPTRRILPSRTFRGQATHDRDASEHGPPMSAIAAAAGQIIRAAEAHDRASLRSASIAYLEAAPLPAGALYGSPLSYSHLGAALVSGRGPSLGSQLYQALRYEPPDSDVPVLFASVSEDRLLPRALRELFHVRLLTARYQPILRPGMKIPAYLRADLRRADRLLAGLGSKDARLTKSAIGAFIRSDARGFSLLGYALYEVAAQRGIVLKRPRKYDF